MVAFLLYKFMTKRESNELIAEILNWQVGFDKQNGEPFWIDPSEDNTFDHPPQYSDSLDACREFENTLNDDERVYYMHHIVHINIVAWKLSENELKAYLLLATPLQRCEAFLRMKGQWE